MPSHTNSSIVMCVGGKADGASESPRLLFHCSENVNTFSISARPQSVIHSKPQITPTVRGQTHLLRTRLHYKALPRLCEIG